ncbi:MAG: elongation factor G [Erysipelotrichaceae bacterium]|jgi:elongation factor G|nr:elongation factor G [Erysipelotrichaceae bacterium]
MRDYLANEVRNICLLGHSGSGKTALVESILFYNKLTDRLGKTLDGNSAMDFDSEEIRRGLSIYSAIAPVEWKDCKINFIDTPGYLDYQGEMEAGLAVADNALIIVSARDGVQSGTERAVRAASARFLPTIFFVNKMDEENASFDKTYDQLRERFGKTVIPFEMPIVENGAVIGSVNILKNQAWYYKDLTKPAEVPAGIAATVKSYYDQIAEAVAMGDDELMEKFFSGEPFSDEELKRGLMIGVRAGEIKPVFCGSAAKGTGIERLLDLITEYFPSYAEIKLVPAYNEKGEEVRLETNEKEAMTAFVFKTIIDPFVGRISFLKVMTGVLSSDTQIINVQKDKNEKISNVFVAFGKNQIAVGKLFTGDIGVVVKLQNTDTNDTLATRAKMVYYKPIDFPKPMLGLAIWPKSKNDEDKLSTGINRILEEDPSAKLVKNAETKEQVLYGLGDQHIDVLLSKLKNKYKVEVTTTEPKVQYRETILGKAEVQGKHKKQSGGAGQYGDVWVRFEPAEGDEMIFAEEVFGGAVPRQYFPAVEAGLRECMEKGVLAGYKVVGVKATLYDGSYHPVDSKEIAFKSAARLAYRAGMPKAKPIILEPIGKCEVIIPDEFTGTIIGDFNKRRGIILGMDMVEGGDQKVTVEVPMAEMQKYATELRSMTQGRGSFYLEFSRYEHAPQPVADKVIAEAAKNKQEEDED